MTTSNHSPFTFPEGKIDLPSGGGRYGGVKYTDYALSQLMAKAKEQPWFDDTVFVKIARFHSLLDVVPVDLHQLILFFPFFLLNFLLYHRYVRFKKMLSVTNYI